jgi:hypothetical protein
MGGFTFTKATKKALKGRLAIEGPSGSGKTWTALLFAQALGKRIAVADTEHKRALLYADIFEFDHLDVTSFPPEAVIEILGAAANHDVCVIDSLSHFWMGTDGMLEQVDRAARRSGGGNSFAGWKEMRPAERRMIEAMLAFPGHLIVTMRSKTEWVIEENDRGKKVPRKIGLKAEQREGIEYEFDLVGSMDHENTMVVTKSRCPALSGAVVQKPGEEFGRTFLDWLESGEAEGPSAIEIRDEALDPLLTVPELKALFEKAEQYGRTGAAVMTDTGDVQPLGDFIRNKAREAQARERAAQAVTE